VEGTILAVLPRALYRVRLATGHDVIAHIGAGPRKNFVRLIVGDRVVVALAARDKTRGRIEARIGQ